MDEVIRLLVMATLIGGAADAGPVDLRDTVPAMQAVQLHVAGGHFAQPARVHPDAWLGSDKFRHFWMSYATTAFTFGAARAAGLDRDAALAGSIAAGAVAGVGKEIYDRRAGEIFSVRDLVADGLGIVAAFLLLREVR